MTSELDGCRRCPQCGLLPEPTTQDGVTWTLECPRHGWMAIGSPISQAVAHWNHLIRKAA